MMREIKEAGNKGIILLSVSQNSFLLKDNWLLLGSQWKGEGIMKTLMWFIM